MTDRQTDISRNYWKLAQHSATLSLPTTLRRRYNTCCIRSSTIDSSRRTGAKSKIDVYHGYAATRPPFLPALSSAAATANIGLSHNFAAPLHLNIIKGPPDPSLLHLQSSPFFLILSINQSTSLLLLLCLSPKLHSCTLLYLLTMSKFIVNSTVTASRCYIPVATAKIMGKQQAKKIAVNKTQNLVNAKRSMATFVSPAMTHYNAADFQHNAASDGTFVPTVSTANEEEVHIPGHSQH